jgi:hypothetical protein
MDEPETPRTGTRWSIAGGITGGTTLALLIVLATLAVAQPGPMSRGYALGLTTTLLLGTTSAGLLIAGWAMTWVESRNGEFTAQVLETSRAYAEGVSDTVDRLAQALPSPPSIRRVS